MCSVVLRQKPPPQALMRFVNTHSASGLHTAQRRLRACFHTHAHEKYFINSFRTKSQELGEIFTSSESSDISLSRNNGCFTLCVHKKITGRVTPTENLVPECLKYVSHARKDVALLYRSSIGKWGY